ncbi:MAG: GFA family protein [Bradymonadia bacterium]
MSTLETFSGQCHCGAVKFEVDVGQRVADACNCSLCFQKGFVHVIVPKDRFRLLQGAERLTTYTFNTGVAQHTFCDRCGVQAFYTPRSHPDGVSVNLRSLGPEIYETFTIRPFDGRNWEKVIGEIAGYEGR